MNDVTSWEELDARLKRKQHLKDGKNCNKTVKIEVMASVDEMGVKLYSCVVVCSFSCLGLVHDWNMCMKQAVFFAGYFVTSLRNYCSMLEWHLFILPSLRRVFKKRHLAVFNHPRVHFLSSILFPNKATIINEDLLIMMMNYFFLLIGCDLEKVFEVIDAVTRVFNCLSFPRASDRNLHAPQNHA